MNQKLINQKLRNRTGSGGASSRIARGMILGKLDGIRVERNLKLFASMEIACRRVLRSLSTLLK